MPREYEAIRDALRKHGKPMDTAQRIAAATYNKRHPGNPMGSGHSYDTHAAVRSAMKHKAYAR